MSNLTQAQKNSRKSRNKGKQFERKIAKALSEWSGVDLMRTPMSGAWAQATGDIQTRTDDFPFVVECKNQEGWTLEAVMVGQCKQFDDWWSQVTADVERKQQETGQPVKPMLVFTRNFKPIFVALDGLPAHFSSYVQERIDQEPNVLWLKGMNLFIITLEELLAYPYARIVEAINETV